ncbi:MAG: hypothetical protein KDK65_06345, partial [Chlamydiia bacterium]|nr:hypothetical protein [Chlamydiia bacterium]
LFLMASSHLFGFIAKGDVGPLTAWIDELDRGNTTDTRQIWGARGDGLFVLDNGFTTKANLWAGAGEGAKIFQVAGAIGWSIPISPILCTCIFGGISYGYYTSDITLFDQKFDKDIRSVSPNFGCDVTVKLYEGLRATGSVQYAFATAWTKIPKLVDKVSHSEGPTYSVLIENDFNEYLSLNIAAAYNISLSKKKLGLRATGLKAGIAYWF